MNEKSVPSGVCTDDAKRYAHANVTRAIQSTAHFPGQVFSANWHTFLFFDSDRMFNGSFAAQVRSLLEIEGGTCACMINLDEALYSREQNIESYCVFIDRTTTDEAFQSSLLGRNVAEGWIYGVDRFGCASDVGEWSIYCERRQEIAVIAFRTSDSSLTFESVATQLEARSVKLAIEKPLSYGFTTRALSPEWQAKLMSEYT